MGLEPVTRVLQYYAWQRPKSIDRLSETRTKVFLLYYEGLYFIGLSRLSWFNMATISEFEINYPNIIFMSRFIQLKLKFNQ